MNLSENKRQRNVKQERKRETQTREYNIQTGLIKERTLKKWRKGNYQQNNYNNIVPIKRQASRNAECPKQE